MQGKIGKIATAFSFLVAILNTISTVTKSGNNLYDIFDISLYFAYAVLFGVTWLINNSFTKYMQVFILFTISVYMAFNSSVFTAFIVLFVCISMLYVYGLYKTKIVFKACITILIIFLLFVLCPSHNHNILSAISWTGLFFTFCLMMWYIFVDTINKIKKETHDERLLEEIKRSLIINERLILLTREMAEKLEGRS